MARHSRAQVPHWVAGHSRPGWTPLGHPGQPGKQGLEMIHHLKRPPWWWWTSSAPAFHPTTHAAVCLPRVPGKGGKRKVSLSCARACQLDDVGFDTFPERHEQKRGKSKKTRQGWGPGHAQTCSWSMHACVCPHHLPAAEHLTDQAPGHPPHMRHEPGGWASPTISLLNRLASHDLGADALGCRPSLFLEAVFMPTD